MALISLEAPGGMSPLVSTRTTPGMEIAADVSTVTTVPAATWVNARAPCTHTHTQCPQVMDVTIAHRVPTAHKVPTAHRVPKAYECDRRARGTLVDVTHW